MEGRGDPAASRRLCASGSRVGVGAAGLSEAFNTSGYPERLAFEYIQCMSRLH
jgi:hypothetical protein